MWFWIQIFFIKVHIEINEHLYWLFFTLIFAHLLIISASFELTLILKTCQILSPWNFTSQWYPKLELSSSLSKILKNAKNAMSVLTWVCPTVEIHIWLLAQNNRITVLLLDLALKTLCLRMDYHWWYLVGALCPPFPTTLKDFLAI